MGITISNQVTIDEPSMSSLDSLEATDATEDELEQEALFRQVLVEKDLIQKEIQAKMEQGLSFDEALERILAERGLPIPAYAQNVACEEPPMPLVELSELLNLVDCKMKEIGVFTRVSSTDLPSPYERLLDHNEHMTVTVEAFHHSSVSVEVLNSRIEESCYVREILLRRESDGQVVQYGIVRLKLDALDEAPRSEILAEKTPLGRVLIEHNVLRNVELVDLWEIQMGPRLAKHFGSPEGAIAYGRTAMIYFNQQPALELLEIVRHLF